MEGRSAEAHALDVGNEAMTVATFSTTAAAYGRIDILINNAGIGVRQATADMTPADWDSVFAVNMTGAFRCAREASRHMLRAGTGAIVNVASVMGLGGGGLQPNGAYHASKGALLNWTRALAVEWAGRIRVTPWRQATLPPPTEKGCSRRPIEHAAIVERQPIGRLIEPEEVAAAICFLASDAASGITGVTFPVDGGWTAR